MKIDRSTKSNALNTLIDPAGTKSSGKASTLDETTRDKDSVELSGVRADVAKLVSRVKETPVIRQDKVDAIKAAIENGTYKIDGQQLARSILKNNLLDEML